MKSKHEDVFSEQEQSQIKDVLLDCEDIILELEKNFERSPYIELLKRLQSIVVLLDEDSYRDVHHLLQRLQSFFRQMDDEDFSTKEVVDHILTTFDEIKQLFETKSADLLHESESTLQRLKRITDGHTKRRGHRNRGRIHRKSFEVKDLLVYLLDDEPHFLEVMKHSLEEFGCTVKEHLTKEELKYSIFADFPDLVLIDNHLADQTGISIIRTLTKLAAGLPCALVTGNLDEDVLNQAVNAGAITALSKPVDKINLKEVLNTAALRKNHFRYMNSAHALIKEMKELLLVDDDLKSKIQQTDAEFLDKVEALLARGEIIGLK